jgi:hypothetical protein
MSPSGDPNESGDHGEGPCRSFRAKPESSYQQRCLPLGWRTRGPLLRACARPCLRGLQLRVQVHLETKTPYRIIGGGSSGGGGGGGAGAGGVGGAGAGGGGRRGGGGREMEGEGGYDDGAGDDEDDALLENSP